MMGDQEIRQAWEKLWKESNGGQIVAPLDLVLQTIDVLILLDVKCKMNETEDANIAPVVRCKECRHSSLPSGFTQRYGEPGTLSCHYGPCNRRNVKEDDFCSYGQRKEADHD